MRIVEVKVKKAASDRCPLGLKDCIKCKYNESVVLAEKIRGLFIICSYEEDEEDEEEEVQK